MDKNPMTPTPEQIEKMAHDFVRSNECEVMDDYSAHEATYKAGAHAMQSLMEAQNAELKDQLKTVSEALRWCRKDVEAAMKLQNGGRRE